MHPKKFIEKLDEVKIASAISQAEKGSSGEIRVCVSNRHRADALGAAQQRFHMLGMAATPQRNAILIYFVPFGQCFALWGDVGVHEKCGAEFWLALTAKINLRLKDGEITEAIEEAVHDVGAMLALHFPREVSSQNHLANTLARE